ncbi:hypothetical protein [Plantibacter sp. YIM 135347]|uniref:hypothetical protein n=1 Tax=Plantibacter sp. YIM 135347 TaxID=3423919 RepID=UPI003D333A3A
MLRLSTYLITSPIARVTLGIGLGLGSLAPAFFSRNVVVGATVFIVAVMAIIVYAGYIAALDRRSLVPPVRLWRQQAAVVSAVIVLTAISRLLYAHTGNLLLFVAFAAIITLVAVDGASALPGAARQPSDAFSR